MRRRCSPRLYLTVTDTSSCPAKFPFAWRARSNRRSYARPAASGSLSAFCPFPVPLAFSRPSFYFFRAGFSYITYAEGEGNKDELRRAEREGKQKHARGDGVRRPTGRSLHSLISKLLHGYASDQHETLVK